AMLELRDRPGQQLIQAERRSKIECGEPCAQRRHVDRRYNGSARHALVGAQQLAREIVIPPYAFVAWRKERRNRGHRILRRGHIACCRQVVLAGAAGPVATTTAAWRSATRVDSQLA